MEGRTDRQMGKDKHCQEKYKKQNIHRRKKKIKIKTKNKIILIKVIKIIKNKNKVK